MTTRDTQGQQKFDSDVEGTKPIEDNTDEAVGQLDSRLETNGAASGLIVSQQSDEEGHLALHSFWSGGNLSPAGGIRGSVAAELDRKRRNDAAEPVITTILSKDVAV